MFQPQVTIQHPLAYAIDLYFYLFHPGPSSTQLIAFAGALPLKDSLKTLFQNAKSEEISITFQQLYRTHLGGLLFFHALTLSSMVKGAEISDEALLQETAKSYEDFRQIDAKMKLGLLVRRPFSDLLYEIRQGVSQFVTDKFSKGFLGQTYAQNFSNFMLDNTLFKATVPGQIQRANYAEQFFGSNGQPADLRRYLDDFDDAFLNSLMPPPEDLHQSDAGSPPTTPMTSEKEKEEAPSPTPSRKVRDTMHGLLHKGILSTTMVRHLKCESNLYSLIKKIRQGARRTSFCAGSSLCTTGEERVPHRVALAAHLQALLPSP